METKDLPQGPCMKWCVCNPETFYFAQGAAMYIIASVIYFIATRFVETPFINSLTDEQKEIKNKSAGTRMLIFIVAIIISVIFISIVKPFRKK
tara:strand:+ start:921 stop:1199 length:279 start_codon:yes stop_codon:yes gene_type:complete